ARSAAASSRKVHITPSPAVLYGSPPEEVTTASTQRRYWLKEYSTASSGAPRFISDEPTTSRLRKARCSFCPSSCRCRPTRRLTIASRDIGGELPRSAPGGDVAGPATGTAPT